MHLLCTYFLYQQVLCVSSREKTSLQTWKVNDVDNQDQSTGQKIDNFGSDMPGYVMRLRVVSQNIYYKSSNKTFFSKHVLAYYVLSTEVIRNPQE